MIPKDTKLRRKLLNAHHFEHLTKLFLRVLNKFFCVMFWVQLSETKAHRRIADKDPIVFAIFMHGKRLVKPYHYLCKDGNSLITDLNVIIHDYIIFDTAFLICKQPDYYSILHVHKVYLEGVLLMFFYVSMLHVDCYGQRTKSIQFFNPMPVINMGAQVNSGAIAYISWLIKTFK